MIRAYSVSSVRSAEAAAMAGLGEGGLMARDAAGRAGVGGSRLAPPGVRPGGARVGVGRVGLAT